MNAYCRSICPEKIEDTLEKPRLEFYGTSAHFTGDLSLKTQCSQWEKPESATTTASEHSYFALYEAYGRRPYEWGDDPDRFKANTKQEEKSLGLLCERHRYRDLETGTFLCRDPIGYEDGPNIYCYVHCNPITHFDPLGLETVRAKFERANVMPLYHAWNFLSLGTLGKNDRLVERMESGEISVSQWRTGSVGNGGVALATVAVSGGTGALVKNAAVKGGASLVAQGTLTGASASFTASSTDVLGTRINYAAQDISYEGTVGGDLTQIGTSTLLGTTLGYGFGQYGQYKWNNAGAQQKGAWGEAFYKKTTTDKIIVEQPTVQTANAKVRPDFYVKAASGQNKFVDVKTGPKAGYTPNQKISYPEIQSNGGVWKGGNAGNAGLSANSAIAPTPVETITYSGGVFPGGSGAPSLPVIVPQENEE